MASHSNTRASSPTDSFSDFDMDLDDLPAVDWRVGTQDPANRIQDAGRVGAQQAPNGAVGAEAAGAAGAGAAAAGAAAAGAAAAGAAAAGAAAAGAAAAGAAAAGASGAGAAAAGAAGAAGVAGAAAAGEENVPRRQQRAGHQWRARRQRRHNLVDLLYDMANPYRGGGKGQKKKKKD